MMIGDRANANPFYSASQAQVGQVQTASSAIDRAIDRLEDIGRSLEMTKNKLSAQMDRIHGPECEVLPMDTSSDIDRPSAALARLNDLLDRLSNVAKGLEAQASRAASI